MGPMRLFLCGDVMTGRGIDQILPHPGDPQLYEGHVRSALDYVALAERESGAIPRSVPFDYIWGDALVEIEQRQCDARIINLETAVTAGGEPELKGINYRMHPANIGCIQAADVDCCVLANNHIADWGRQGLADTLDALAAAGIASTGAGRDIVQAMRPAIISLPGERRILVFAFGSPSAGVSRHWAAGPARPGVSFLADLSAASAAAVAECVGEWRQPGDVVVVSIHWGPNWGYDVSAAHRQFARLLIEQAEVNIVHGHSSHHPIGIEVIRGRPVIYGCGDFINDYEGIRGHEAFHPELALAYFVELDESGRLAGLDMVPFRMMKFRLNRLDRNTSRWLAATLQRECRSFGHAVILDAGGVLKLQW
jgi:poly-gamma-glutamate synthesis protein (capsule biosynthesis protein)